ncbi:MAG: acyltransferase family protein [Sphingobacteriales bacterium]|nr:acyltransferase family protein [Sphingobacteriales bacterium]
MSNLQAGQRYHGIDALRAFAMILGIFLHATIVYKEKALPVWPHDTYSHSPVFDYFYFLIHTFRMPLFFMVAGFFCRFLIYKVGVAEFIRRRWQRIGIPFLGSLIFILPVTVFPFLYHQNSAVYGADRLMNLKASFKQLFGWNGIAHLWFLYYLLLYYIVAVVYVRAASLPVIRPVSTYLLKVVNNSKGYAISLALIAIGGTWGILLLQGELLVPVDTGLVPGFVNLLFYGFFMGLGWVINTRSSVFDFMVKNAAWLLGAGLLISGFIFYQDYHDCNPPSFRLSIVGIKLLLSAQIIFLVFGITGIFLHYFRDESRLWRYLSDAAYWMYLVHMGLVVFLQLILLQFNIHSGIKFIAVFSVTLAFTILTYQFFVRYTRIGIYLHGPRHRKKGEKFL